LNDPQQKIMSKVTVVVVNWNGEKFLKQCLAALLNQTLIPHEIIVVDNASTDLSLAIARSFPSVRLLALDSNTGFARANNLAIAAASVESEWIALINPDAFAEPGWLAELIAAAETNPGFDVFGSQLIDANEPTLLDGAGDVYHMSGLVWRMGHGRPLPLDNQAVREAFSPCAGAALYKRSALREIGGFDEDYFCYVEDVDLGFRLRLAGYRCLYVPQSIAHHIGSGTTGGQHSDFAMYHGHRNLVWTFVKNMPGILFWLLLPLHLALNLICIIFFSYKGYGRVILRSKRDACLGLPKMWKKRQHIQKHRIATIGAIWHQLDKRLNRNKLVETTTKDPSEPTP
jgi:GT2 family glycosyltransferase